jgi:hypothetical protein
VAQHAGAIAPYGPDLPDRWDARIPVNPSAQKYFCFTEIGIGVWFVHPASVRGALRDRHGRWVRDAVDAFGSKANDLDADGEVAWSWHPLAGAKFAGTMLYGNRAGDGD